MDVAAEFLQFSQIPSNVWLGHSICTQRFALSEVGTEGFVNLEMDQPGYYKLGCSYFEVAGKCNVYLDYYLTGEPEAYLIVGCAYWLIPRQFAEQLVHVFLLGDTSRIKC